MTQFGSYVFNNSEQLLLLLGNRPNGREGSVVEENWGRNL